MTILSIDTCLGRFSLSIQVKNETFFYNNSDFNQQSQLLASTLKNLLHHAEITLNDVSTILITNGPGSFTGIRIGLAFVQGINSALNTKVLACSTLCCFDIIYPQQDCLMTINAGRGIYYAQRFTNNFPIESPIIMTQADLDQLDPSFIIGHYRDSKCMPEARKMLALYAKPEYQSLFGEDLQPTYIRESYF